MSHFDQTFWSDYLPCIEGKHDYISNSREEDEFSSNNKQDIIVEETNIDNYDTRGEYFSADLESNNLPGNGWKQTRSSQLFPSCRQI